MSNSIDGRFSDRTSTGAGRSAVRPAMKVAASVVAGISGARQNAAAAVSVDGEIRAFCEEERVSRVRGSGLVPGSFPRRALETALHAAGSLTPADVRTYASAEPSIELPASASAVHLDHHRAHAATAFYLSGFGDAAVLVCDHHSAEPETFWSAADGRLRPIDRPASGQGFAALYSDGAAAFGFVPGQEHQLEALARLDPGAEAGRFDEAITFQEGVLRVSPRWAQVVTDWLASGARDNLRHRARVAAAFQHHIGELLLRLVADLRARAGSARLCLGGGLFYNTYFTTIIRQAGAFDDVFIAPNPGNAGIAMGAALSLAEEQGLRRTALVSPFLGPEYSGEDIKRTLDNCKLSYECLDERDVIGVAVNALVRGHLVGWFQGRMEWGHRALGNRSILASPLSPYVLDNLNVFLKHRQRHRAYGVSVPEAHAGGVFEGPPSSRHMEYEYRPVDRDRFTPIMPEGTETIRVQTIPDQAAPGSSERCRLLHEAFGQATGIPVLVNTSFNGFSEPMVCSPRDAIRVFFGTGLDLLIMDRFVVRK